MADADASVRPLTASQGKRQSRYKSALEQVIRQHNRDLDAGDDTDSAKLTVIMVALLHQNELLEELVSRTTPF